MSEARVSVVITDAVALLSPAIEHLRAEGVEVDVVDDGLSPQDVIRRASSGRIVISAVTVFGAEELALLESTELIVRSGIGYDHIDVEAATAAGIVIANVPDFCIDEVADHTMALLLASARRLPHMLTMWQESLDWRGMASLPTVNRLRGRTLGLIGAGRIGRAVARRARGFGLEVVAYDPMAAQDGAVELVDLEELLATSNIVSLHCPLTTETRHLMDEVAFSAMKPGSILINASRGGLVDLDALATAVESGRLGGAALDVLEGEPDPDLGHRVLGFPNVLLTPHVAWYSIEARRDLALHSAHEALQYINEGRVRNPVNPEVFGSSAGG